MAKLQYMNEPSNILKKNRKQHYFIAFSKNNYTIMHVWRFIKKNIILKYSLKNRYYTIFYALFRFYRYICPNL